MHTFRQVFVYLYMVNCPVISILAPEYTCWYAVFTYRSPYGVNITIL